MKIVVDRDKVISLGAAIEKKNGLGTTDLLSLDEMIDEVNAIETGSGAGHADQIKDINFYDYDGTLLYSYSFDEASHLTRLPKAPEHEGLTFQCWTEQSIDFIKRTKLPIDVGAIFTTSDGKTHLRVKVLKDSCSVTYQGVAIKGAMYLNWGDGKEDVLGCNQYTSLSSSSLYGNLSHVYEKAGIYDVTVWGEGCDELLVDTCTMVNNSGSCLILEVHYSDQVKRIGNSYVSGSTYLYSCLFANVGLQRVSIPNSVTSIYQLMTAGSAPSYSFIVLPPSLEEMLGTGGNNGGGLIRYIYPRTVKTFLGSSDCRMYCYDFENLIFRFPSLEFVKKSDDGRYSSNTAYPTITYTGGNSSYIKKTYFIFSKMDEELIGKASIPSGNKYLYVPDDSWPVCKAKWDSMKGYGECIRISMKEGTGMDSSCAEELGVTATDKGIAINAATDTVEGTKETIDSGILYVVQIRPSEYDGVILEVGY